MLAQVLDNVGVSPSKSSWFSPKESYTVAIHKLHSDPTVWTRFYVVAESLFAL